MSFLRNLFKERGTKNVITLFHSPSSQPSLRALNILKQANATASSHATLDQASNHDQQSTAERYEFELDVQESAPTSDQLKSILEYLGSGNIGTVIEGANSESDALKKLKSNENAFKRPLIVDWNNGKAIPGDNESEILRLLKQTKETSK